MSAQCMQKLVILTMPLTGFVCNLSIRAKT